MKIKPFCNAKEQMAQLGSHSWSVARLFELAKDLPIMYVPLNHLDLSKQYDKLRIRDMVMHMKTVNDADLNYPIILDEDGEIMDGRHRIMKALLTGAETIKAVRFDENPTPCRVTD